MTTDKVWNSSTGQWETPTPAIPPVNPLLDLWNNVTPLQSAKDYWFGQSGPELVKVDPNAPKTRQQAQTVASIGQLTGNNAPSYVRRIDTDPVIPTPFDNMSEASLAGLNDTQVFGGYGSALSQNFTNDQVNASIAAAYGFTPDQVTKIQKLSGKQRLNEVSGLGDLDLDVLDATELTADGNLAPHEFKSPTNPITAGLGAVTDTGKSFLGGTRNFLFGDKADASSRGLIGSLGTKEGLDTLGNVLGGLGKFASGYAGLKQLDLAEDSFKFNRNLALTNLRNQTQLVNNQIRERADYRIHAGTALGAEKGLTSEEIVQRYGVSTGFKPRTNNEGIA